MKCLSCHERKVYANGQCANCGYQHEFDNVEAYRNRNSFANENPNYNGHPWLS